MFVPGPSAGTPRHTTRGNIFGNTARLVAVVGGDMGAIPGSIDTTRQPPMTVPLRHFVVALAFLIAGTALGLGLVVDAFPGRRLVHIHLLLAGWVCITIMGAMTQFVPVWSGATLHSRRLANLQLGLVSGGLVGFAVAVLLGRMEWVFPFGVVMLAGFWTFVYNLGRTLATVDGFDVTERHFAVALAFFVVLTALGALLALNFAAPVFGRLGVTHAGVLGAHATVAVFGAVLTTIYGALYQLGTMFTRTELRGLDHRLRDVETVGHPLGVVGLGAGRLLEAAVLARLGGLLLLGGALAFGVVLARKLSEMQVERTPMHTRYAVVVTALVLWAVLSVPAWARDPLAREHLFGAPGSVHLLFLGVVGFVVLGTLYHIIPFIIWVHTYSDRLGFEDVPMIDDLYDERLAAVDATLLVWGTVLLVGSDWFDASVTAAAGMLLFLGVVVFTANMVLVLHRHGPHSLDRVLLGSLSPRRSVGNPDEPVEE